MTSEAPRLRRWWRFRFGWDRGPVILWASLDDLDVVILQCLKITYQGRWVPVDEVAMAVHQLTGRSQLSVCMRLGRLIGLDYLERTADGDRADKSGGESASLDLVRFPR